MRAIAISVPVSTQENKMNRAVAVFGLSMIALYANVAEAAPKAEKPAPIACVEDVSAATPVTAECIDLDGDKFPSNAADETLRDHVDDPAKSPFARFAYPGAPIAVKDGLDTDKDGSDDDAEWEEMIEAAGGPDSPGWLKLEQVVNLCVEDKNEAVYGLEFAWGVDNGRHTCLNLPAGAKFDSEAGVKLRPIVVEERRRIAAVKAVKEGADAEIEALKALIGHEAIEGLPAEGEHPAIESVPATGLFAKIADAEKRLAEANAAEREEIREEIVKFQHDMQYAQDLLDRRVDALARRMGQSETNGSIFTAGAQLGMMGGPAIYSGDPEHGGQMIRSGLSGGLAATLSFGYGWTDGRTLLLEAEGGVGSTNTQSGEKPVPFGGAGIVHSWRMSESIRVGIGPGVVINAVGDPISPDATEMAVGARLTGSLRLPSANARVCKSLVTRGLLAGGTHGFNEYRAGGFVTSLAVGVEFGACPVDMEWMR